MSRSKREAEVVRAGFAKAPLLVGAEVPFLGVPPHRVRYFSGIHSPLNVRTCYVEGPSGGAVFVALDLIGIGDLSLADWIRHGAASAAGIEASQCFVTCTHAHNTPDTLGLSDCQTPMRWLRSMTGRIEEAAREARRSAEPCFLTQAATDVPDLNVNRRIMTPQGIRRPHELGDQYVPAGATQAKDSRLTVLVFRRTKDRSIKGILYHYTAHAVAAMGIPEVSADFPGACSSMIEGVLGRDTTALFMNGAAGDVNINFAVRALAEADRLGRALGQRVLRLVSSAGESCGTTLLQTVLTDVQLTRRPLPTLERGPREPVDGGERSAEDPSPPALNDTFHELELMALRSTVPESRVVSLQVLWMSEKLGMVFIPGEAFAELGWAIRQARPDATVLPVGYANGWLGYFPTAEAFRDGGYEVIPSRWSPWEPGTGERLARAAARAVQARAGLVRATTDYDDDWRLATGRARSGGQDACQ